MFICSFQLIKMEKKSKQTLKKPISCVNDHISECRNFKGLTLHSKANRKQKDFNVEEKQLLTNIGNLFCNGTSYCV